MKLKITASGPHRGSEEECQEEREKEKKSLVGLFYTVGESILQRKLELETILRQSAHQEEATRSVKWLSARPYSLQQQHSLHSQETASVCHPANG